MKLSSKISIGFGLVLSLFIVLMLINKRFSGYVRQDVEYLRSSEKVVRLSDDLQKLTHTMENNFNTYLLLDDSIFVRNYHIASGKFHETYRDGGVLVMPDDTQLFRLYSELGEVVSRWKRNIVVPILIAGQNASLDTSFTGRYRELYGLHILSGESKRLLDTAHTIFSEMDRHLYNQRNNYSNELELSLYRSSTIEFVLAIFILLIGIMVTVYTTRHISTRMNSMIGMAETISQGNYSIKIKDAGNDEMSRLAAALNRMTQAIQYSFTRLEKANRQLSLANKDLERVAFLASHDLNEPLRMISLYTQMLRDKYGEQMDDTAREYMEFSVEGSRRIISMLNDLLTYVKLTQAELEFEDVDMNECCLSAKEKMQDQLTEAHAMVRKEDLPVIRGNRFYLQELFLHLFSNAIKFRSEKKPCIHIWAEEKHGEWVFAFKDNGIGLDEEYTERVFTVFQRLYSRNEYPGNGLGLSLSKKIAEMHGGRIWFRSQPGQGATFYFSLPAKVQD